MNYFHAFTKKYNKRRNVALVLIIAPVAEFSMMIIWAVMFNIKRADDIEFILPYGIIAGAGIAGGMLLCWLCCGICEVYVRNSRKYTYFEIQQKAAVFCKYKGSYRIFGKKTVLSMVCVIPMKTYEKAFLDEKKKHIILTGKIHIYEGDQKMLSYHIKDGSPVFDKWWYNEAENSYKTVDMIRLPMDFEHPGRIAAALGKAKLEFEAIPPKKEYVFKESAIVRRRKELKKMAESRRYIRYW